MASIKWLAERNARGAMLLFLLFALQASTRAQDCSDQGRATQEFTFRGLQPVLLLTEYNPWAMAIGSDTPTFAAYVDGTVIYWKGDFRSGQYVSTHLQPPQLVELLASVHIQRLAQLRTCYTLTRWSDQHTNVLVLKTDRGFKSISVYGSIRQPPSHDAGTDELPPDLTTAFAALLNFGKPDAQPWKPPLFEVIVWPFPNAKGKPAVWPSDWPDFTDRNTVKRQSSYSIYLPISQLDKYRAFMRGVSQTHAILIDGKKWTTSARLPFPHELQPSTRN